MIIIIFLFAFETIIYLFLGFYVLILNPKEQINHFFNFITFTLITMSFAGIMLQLTSNEMIAQTWFKIGAIGFVCYIYFVLLFCIKLTDLFNLKKIFYIILFLPTVYYIIAIILIPQIVILKKYNNIWIMNSILINSPFLLYSHITYQFSYLITSIVLLIIWSKRSKSIVQKHQTLIILVTLFLSLIFGVFDQLIFFHLFNLYNSIVPGFFSIYFLIWTFGIWYAIVKYRFLTDNSKKSK